MTTKNVQPTTSMVLQVPTVALVVLAVLVALTEQVASVVLKISSQVFSGGAELHAIQTLLVKGMTSSTV